MIIYKNDPEGIGILHQKSVAETAPLHTHMRFFEVFLVVNGKALHVVNEQVDLLSAGCFVLVRPEDVHCYDFYLMHDFEFYNISLDAFEFEKIAALFNHDQRIHGLLSSQASPVFQLNENDVTTTRQQIMLIEQQLNNGRFIEAKHTLKLMICELIWKYSLMKEAAQLRPAGTVPAWLSELVARMHQPSHYIEGVPCMVRLSGYTHEYLSRSCKQHLGLTPTQFVNNLRLNHAAKLLRTSSLDILAVSEECGFQAASYFYSLFKKVYGVTPNEYRRTRITTGNA